jgi:hypothetical protein
MGKIPVGGSSSNTSSSTDTGLRYGAGQDLLSQMLWREMYGAGPTGPGGTPGAPGGAWPGVSWPEGPGSSRTPVPYAGDYGGQGGQGTAPPWDPTNMNDPDPGWNIGDVPPGFGDTPGSPPGGVPATWPGGQMYWPSWPIENPPGGGGVSAGHLDLPPGRGSTTFGMQGEIVPPGGAPPVPFGGGLPPPGGMSAMSMPSGGGDYTQYMNQLNQMVQEARQHYAAAAQSKGMPVPRTEDEWRTAYLPMFTPEQFGPHGIQSFGAHEFQGNPQINQAMSRASVAIMQQSGSLPGGTPGLPPTDPAGPAYSGQPGLSFDPSQINAGAQPYVRPPSAPSGGPPPGGQYAVGGATPYVGSFGSSPPPAPAIGQVPPPSPPPSGGSMSTMGASATPLRGPASIPAPQMAPMSPGVTPIAAPPPPVVPPGTGGTPPSDLLAGWTTGAPPYFLPGGAHPPGTYRGPTGPGGPGGPPDPYTEWRVPGGLDPNRIVPGAIPGDYGPGGVPTAPPPGTPGGPQFPPGSPGAGGLFAGGASGARQITGQGTYDQLAAMLRDPGYSPAVRSAMAQEGQNAARAGFAGAGGQIMRHAATTGNSAGVNAGLAELGRAQAGAFGQQARQNAIDQAKESQRQREWATQGMGTLYGGESSFLSNLLGQQGNVQGRVTQSSSRTKARADKPLFTL